jgi:hypothetical protein
MKRTLLAAGLPSLPPHLSCNPGHYVLQRPDKCMAIADPELDGVLLYSIGLRAVARPRSAGAAIGSRGTNLLSLLQRSVCLCVLTDDDMALRFDLSVLCPCSTQW